MAKESLKNAELRWAKLKLLQEEYKEFDTFLIDVMEDFMGFTCSDIQLDIGKYLEQGPRRAMIQAQRGRAKTTITAIYAVWSLIHDPTTRILIVSAGGAMARQISNWIIQIITGYHILECLVPDSSNGDRTSVEAFDVHYTLKGPEKSPSVACLGVSSNMQGFRADLLIPDDIESQKNSKTQVTRDHLLQLTRDFTSICSKGKILYLGTPQSIDSIYNSLPSRGYDIRIWPGRYPTEEEEENYGSALAPLIKERMQVNPDLRTGGGPTGDRGKAVDPVLLSETDLTDKELDQGVAYFQLQHMLDTALMDKDRYPLKIENLVFMNIPEDEIPIKINWMRDQQRKVATPVDYPIKVDMFQAHSYSDEWVPFTSTHMWVDPSGTGKNGDELAYAVTKFRAGYVYLVDCGGMPGGLNEANQKRIADTAVKWNVDMLEIEDNFGGGVFTEILTPVVLKAFTDAGHKAGCGIQGKYVKGQKELRIIDTLEPIISSNRLVVEETLVKKDWESCMKYGLEARSTYSLFFQLARITRDRGCLAHDDRLDAVAGSAAYWTELLSIDKNKEQAKAKQEAYNNLMSNPLGNNRGLSYNESNGLQHYLTNTGDNMSYEIEDNTGQRTRRAPAQEEQPTIRAAVAKQQRNRMKPKTDNKLNGSLLPFPTDVHDLTGAVRKAMVSASLRVGSDSAKLKLLLDTVTLLIDHAKERHAFTKEARKNSKPRRRTVGGALVTEPEEASEEAEVQSDPTDAKPASTEVSGAKKGTPKKVAPKKPAKGKKKEVMDFKQALDIVLKHEGGLVDDPRDPGGITKFGISLRAYPNLGEDGIRNLTKADAGKLYKRDYWDKMRCDDLPWYIRLMAFDCAVNQGVGYASRSLQTAVTATPDGVLGPRTLGLAVRAKPTSVAHRFSMNRFERYRRNKNFGIYGNGWLSRLLDITLLTGKDM